MSSVAIAIVASVKAAEVTAEVTAAEVTSATAAPVSSATACLSTRRKQSAGKQRACHYHHRSSNHYIFLSTGTAISDH
jgi:mannose-6-phosphate isomerase-like protein (cupin superfamily)